MIGPPQPDKVVETRKAPYLVRQLSMFRTADYRICVCACGPDGVGKEDIEVYTGSGGMSLRPVLATRVLALVCSRDYKWAREGPGSKVSGGEVLYGCVSSIPKIHSPVGVLPFPFICQGAGVGYKREREITGIPHFLRPACGPR
jgi:hypothetical protein